MMELAFDIGSTEITVGLFDGADLRTQWRLASAPTRTPDELALILRQLLRDQGIEPRRIERVTIASVVPLVASVVATASENALRIEPIAIDARLSLPIQVDVEEPLAVGPDRLVNAIAAHRLYSTDCIVLDLGTATTFDCVSRDGRFLGGVIAPGARTAAERLIERTARLPRVALVAPDRVIGRRTDAALQSGIFFSAIDAVDGMIRRIREEWQPKAIVVATGGLSSVLAPHCKSIQYIEPHLTLLGIRTARDHLERLGRQGVVRSAPPR
jgi:type III pantothenate kinase